MAMASTLGKANPANGGVTSGDNTLPLSHQMGIQLTLQSSVQQLCHLAIVIISSSLLIILPPHHIMRKSTPWSDVDTQRPATAVLMTHQLSCRSSLAQHTNLCIPTHRTNQGSHKQMQSQQIINTEKLYTRHTLHCRVYSQSCHIYIS